MRGLMFACVAMMFIAPAMAAEKITGQAIALDGDTLMVFVGNKRYRIRLWGISAPEMKNIPYGPYARATLDNFLAESKGRVSCEPTGKDRYKRIIAVCTRNKGDIGAGMIALGWASVHRLYAYDGSDTDRADAYDWVEKMARKNRKGMWRDWKP